MFPVCSTWRADSLDVLVTEPKHIKEKIEASTKITGWNRSLSQNKTPEHNKVDIASSFLNRYFEILYEHFNVQFIFKETDLNLRLPDYETDKPPLAASFRKNVKKKSFLSIKIE